MRPQLVAFVPAAAGPPERAALVAALVSNGSWIVWVPRRELDESAVLIGERAWLPFVRARHYGTSDPASGPTRSRDAVLQHSLLKLFRVAERVAHSSVE